MSWYWTVFYVISVLICINIRYMMNFRTTQAVNLSSGDFGGCLSEQSPSRNQSVKQRFPELCHMLPFPAGHRSWWDSRSPKHSFKSKGSWENVHTHTHTRAHHESAAPTFGTKVVWLQQKHELIKQATFSKLWSQLMIPCFPFVISFHADLWKRCRWSRIKILVNNQLEDQVFWYSARVGPRSPASSQMAGLTFSRSSTRVNTGWNHLF